MIARSCVTNGINVWFLDNEDIPVIFDGVNKVELSILGFIEIDLKDLEFVEVQYMFMIG